MSGKSLAEAAVALKEAVEHRAPLKDSPVEIKAQGGKGEKDSGSTLEGYKPKAV